DMVGFESAVHRRGHAENTGPDFTAETGEIAEKRLRVEPRESQAVLQHHDNGEDASDDDDFTRTGGARIDRSAKSSWLGIPESMPCGTPIVLSSSRSVLGDLGGLCGEFRAGVLGVTTAGSAVNRFLGSQPAPWWRSPRSVEDWL